MAQSTSVVASFTLSWSSLKALNFPYQKEPVRLHKLLAARGEYDEALSNYSRDLYLQLLNIIDKMNTLSNLAQGKKECLVTFTKFDAGS